VAEAIPARFSSDGEVGSVEQFVKTPSLEAPPRFRESSSPIHQPFVDADFGFRE
jgi:hypothetical protein